MIHVILALLLLTAPALARDGGRWAQSDPATREWFRSQKVPAGPHAGTSCCSEADGVYAEEDIEDGQYVVTFEAHGRQVKRMRVPEDRVIREPNRHGRAVVWFWFENAEPRIRCFIPGGGV